MDDIKRRLAFIDKELAGRDANYHEQTVNSTPLLFCAAGLLAGIAIQSFLWLSIWVWVALLVACVTAAVLQVVFFDNNPDGRINLVYVAAYLAFGCFVCFGAIRLNSFYTPASNDVRNFVAAGRTLATVRGVIVTKPYTNYEQDWAFSKFKFTDPSSSFYLKLRQVETTGGWSKAAGRLRVQVGEPVPGFNAGDYVQLYCRLERFLPATNPGQFDMAKYAGRKGVFVAASVRTRDAIELLDDKKPGFWAGIERKVRTAATEAIMGDMPDDQSSRGLVKALLLGYRGDIGTDTYEAFRRTGLLHFLSLSGMHVGILLGVIWWLCKTIGLLKRGRAAVCIAAICIFLCVVPPRAPTVRGAIIGLVYCASVLFGRRSNPLNTLSLAAIILLLIRPTGVFEPGWQLSFACVLGILAFAERIHLFMYELIYDISWRRSKPKTNPYFQIVSRPGPFITRLFSVGIAAWLGGAGILLYHFYTINPLTSLWTVVAFPFVALILTIGFLKIIVSFFLPSIAAVLGVIVTGLAKVLICVVTIIAQLDISQILIGCVPVLLVLLYYALVGCGGFVYLRRPMIKKLLCGSLAVIVVGWLGILKLDRTYHSDLRVTVLDVGHGQALVAQLPGKKNILFDAGSLNKSDVGHRAVLPFLRYTGISRIGKIFISHSDIDHINGIPEVARGCEVGGIYAGDVFFDKSDEWGAAAFLTETLHKRGHQLKPLSVHYDAVEHAKITVLWPTEKGKQNSGLSENDLSVVSLIEFAGRKILVCSDIEQPAQREILQRFPGLRADVIIAPHHGSAKTTEHEFLQNLKPKIIVCSCGRINYERKRVIETDGESTIFYTAKNGAVTIRVEKDGRLVTKTFLSP